jgi:hypothetical protein
MSHLRSQTLARWVAGSVAGHGDELGVHVQTPL